MAEAFTLTKHNGRAGKKGVYNPKHNDRSFDISASEHIEDKGDQCAKGKFPFSRKIPTWVPAIKFRMLG